jgi:modulator of FtsH protease HflK
MKCACAQPPPPEEAREPPDDGSRELARALAVSFRVLRGTMIFVVAAYLASGLFVVDQHERAAVLLFGRLQGLPGERMLGPGFHWTFPKPFSEIVRVPAGRVQTIESAAFWYEQTPEAALGGPDAPLPPTLDPLRNGYALSGDANLVHSRWAVRYSIVDPEAYLFSVADPQRLLERTLENGVVLAAARFGVDRLLRTDIESFRGDVLQRLRSALRERECGVAVEGLDIVEIAPPRQVEAAFNAVIEAEQEQSRMVSDARRDAGTMLSAARGESARLVAESESARIRMVSDVAAQADSFQAVIEQYRERPGITARTLRQETLRRVLNRVAEKFVLRGAGGARELRLWIGPQPENPEPAP